MNFNKEKIVKIESLLQYHFKDQEYLKSALTHISYLNETKTPPKYGFKKLEFVGDAVLELVIRKYVFKNYSNQNVQEMFINKIKIVNNNTLAKFGKLINLQKFIILGKGEVKKKITEPSIIADVFEAICGAMFLDSDKITVIEHFLFYHFSDNILLELDNNV